MDYAMAMNYIEEKNKLGSIPGLVNVKELLLRLGNPQNQLKCLHIAGTNGKGSIFAYVESILMENGYKVGRYISPTIFDYRERFSINGEYISEDKLSELMERVADVVDEMTEEGVYNPTAFEIETAIAFLYFLDEQVDFALIECGMGGSMDATNVIEHPLVTVMASISMDHMQYLGNTIEVITKNKAGIMRQDGITVAYPQKSEVEKILSDHAEKINNHITYADTDDLSFVDMDVNGTEFIYKNEKFYIKLLGKRQVYNAITAVEVLNTLSSIGVTIKRKSIMDGLKKTYWPGRMTKACDNPQMYVDGAHNEAAWEFLREGVKKYFTNRKIIYIIGVLKDKEYELMVDILSDTMDYCIAVTPDNKRGLPKEVLLELLSRKNIPCKPALSAEDAISMAKEKAGKDGVIIVSGSLSFIADYLNYNGFGQGNK